MKPLHILIGCIVLFIIVALTIVPIAARAEEEQEIDNKATIMESLQSKLLFSFSGMYSFLAGGIGHFCSTMASEVDSFLNFARICKPTDKTCLVNWLKNSVVSPVQRFLKHVGWNEPPFEEIVKAVESYSEVWPDWNVYAIDAFVVDWKDLIMYQNQKSIEFFGKIDRENGGTKMDDEELYDLSGYNYMLYAVCSPDVEFGPNYFWYEKKCWERFFRRTGYIILSRTKLESNLTLCPH